MVVVVVIAALVVVALAHKSDPANQPTGGAPSNGVTVAAAQPLVSSPGSNNGPPSFGATAVPSPFTGVGLPGANQEYKAILGMQNPPGGPGSRYNAFVSSPKIKGTGLLNPLPDKGTRSKQLLTKDIIVRPGQKL